MNTSVPWQGGLATEQGGLATEQGGLATEARRYLLQVNFTSLFKAEKIEIGKKRKENIKIWFSLDPEFAGGSACRSNAGSALIAVRTRNSTSCRLAL